MGTVNEFRDAVDTDFQAQRLLQLNSCGHEWVSKNDYTILRPRGRRDIHFLYLQNGWVPAEVGEKKARVNAGECVVYLPGVRQMYTLARENSPYTYYVHFTGAAAAEAMSYLEPSENMVFKISDPAAFENLFCQIMRVHNERAPKYVVEENGILLQLISVLVRSSMPENLPVRNDIQLASAYIREHYTENIDLEECAATAHLSLSRFAHLFTASIGVSPRKFILRLRLNRAKNLLRDSLLSVNEIAENVGFSDAQYFSRLFRQYTGVPPSAFRKRTLDTGG